MTADLYRQLRRQQQQIDQLQRSITGITSQRRAQVKQRTSGGIFWSEWRSWDSVTGRGLVTGYSATDAKIGKPSVSFTPADLNFLRVGKTGNYFAHLFYTYTHTIGVSVSTAISAYATGFPLGSIFTVTATQATDALLSGAVSIRTTLFASKVGTLQLQEGNHVEVKFIGGTYNLYNSATLVLIEF